MANVIWNLSSSDVPTGMIYPMLSKLCGGLGASTDIFHSSVPTPPHTHMIYDDIRNELSRANDRYCIQRPLREKSSINNKHIERAAKKCGEKMNKKNHRSKKFPALGNEIKYWCSRTWTRRKLREKESLAMLPSVRFSAWWTEINSAASTSGQCGSEISSPRRIWIK